LVPGPDSHRDISIKLQWQLVPQFLRDRTLVLFVLCSAMSLCCNQSSKKAGRNIERSFYFWRSVFHLSEPEKKALTEFHIKTLYTKFFDVDWDPTTGQPLPVAQVRFQDSAFLKQDSIQIIPVVFITNSCIKNIDSSQAKQLAVKITDLVNGISKANGLTFHELQIDCDWTSSTKENYFKLLETIKSQIVNRKSQISCTIRLHQIKYSNKTGIPPVDRGLLMAYNMGDLKDPSAKNSILETSELKKYIGDLSSYPLPLDVALPLFEWKVLFRQNVYTGLLENFPDSFFNNASIKKTTNRFEVLRDTILNGYEFKKGDIIRKEESSYEEILSAAKLISERLSATNIRLSLFHLDSVILSKYSVYEMENIFNSLR